MQCINQNLLKITYRCPYFTFQTLVCLTMRLMKCTSFDRYWQISSSWKKECKRNETKMQRNMRKLTRKKKIYQVNLENHEKNCSILKLHPTRHWKNASPTYSNVFNVQHKHNLRITVRITKSHKIARIDKCILYLKCF